MLVVVNPGEVIEALLLLQEVERGRFGRVLLLRVSLLARRTTTDGTRARSSARPAPNLSLAERPVTPSAHR